MLRTLLIATARNEGLYLVDWAAYHLSLGFDNILLVTNENNDGSDALIAELVANGIVTHIDNPPDEIIPELGTSISTHHRANWRAVHHPLFLQHDWGSFLDLDEFIVLKKHQSIKDFLDDYSDVSAIALNWRIFGSSELYAYDPAPVIERFTRCSEPNFSLNGLVKPLFRPEQVVFKPLNIGPHYVILKPGQHYTYSDRTPFVNYKDEKNIHHDLIQINHYAVKSRSEYYLKKQRGDADFKPTEARAFKKYNDDYFRTYDRNEAEDTSALSFAERARQRASEIRALGRIAECEAQIRQMAALRFQQMTEPS